MNICSYYYPCSPNEHFLKWEYDIGISLPKCVSDIFNSKCEFYTIKSNIYEICNFSDIAYCQLFAIPEKRPAKFVYSIIGDYIGHEEKTKEWIRKVRPNLICCLENFPEDLINYGIQYECKVVMFPWFMSEKYLYKEKSITAMCSGCTDTRIYPSRALMSNYLKNLNRSDIIVSCSAEFGKYPLSNQEYSDFICKTKYYISGGIFDRFVPPKYYEVASHGACIITFDMDYLSKIGFINGKTCITIKNLSEIPEILSSDKYIEIGKNAQKMMCERHFVLNRAIEIASAYNEFI